MAALPLPPGPREPAAAQTLEWVLRPTALLRRCAARHGDAFTRRLSFDDAPTVRPRSGWLNVATGEVSLSP